MPFCTSCNGYFRRRSEHTCPPLWRCWLDDEEESDGRNVHADSGDLAAERFVEKLEEVGDGDEFVVRVRTKGSTATERHQVSVSLMLTYTSTQLEEIEEDTDDEPTPSRVVLPPSYRLPTTPAEDLLGMPRCITKDGRVEVDGRPGGVRARFESLGQYHAVDINARDVEGEPCADEKALRELVARYLDESYGVSPGHVRLSPLEVDLE